MLQDPTVPERGRPQFPAPPAVAAPGGGSVAPDQVPGTGFRAERVARDLELSAAGRLVTDAAGPRVQAARRLVTAAATHGIDLSLMWATVDRAAGRPSRARQVCLAVPGAGRTVMLMLSGPWSGDEERECAERVSCLDAACAFFAGPECGRDVKLAQALPEPSEPWSVRAFVAAGFVKVGDLAYMRRPLWPPLVAPEPPWPEGVVVRNVKGVGPREPDRAALLEALNRSYEETLDCPELCGLRETEDILESHRATGVFDSKLWWLVLWQGEPHGCMLLSRCPDHNSVELVYLGLSRELRGKRMGSRLLEWGIARLGAVTAESLTCAVDLRNGPARRLYERAGFREFGRRVAMVRRIGPGAH
jgi:mycothiol synthase